MTDNYDKDIVNDTEIKANDRISRFLTPALEGMIFDELSNRYLERTGTADFMTGVPIPVGSGIATGEIDTLTIALNMARVVGSDPYFPYQEQYLRFLDKVFGGNALNALVAEGAKRGEEGDFEASCAFERAALLIDSKSKDALYLYARACLDAYQIEEKSEEYVGLFKAESLEMFELLTMVHPDFEMGFYYLGYGYVNLGLYLKAKLTWEEFMELTDGTTNEDTVKQRVEISERLHSLREPVQIEHAINEILRGNYSYGRNELAKYSSGAYSNWWPLWYYLGVSEASLANYDAAIENYKMALKFSPSNTDVMKELVEIYKAVGNPEAEGKYLKKIEIVEANRATEEKLS